MENGLNRRLVLRGLALTATAPLGACGFRPLLAQADDEGVRGQLASVQVKGLNSRVGQQLRIALEDNLDPTSSRTPALYDLRIRLRRSNNALAIQLDNTITRFNLTLSASFDLRRSEDNASLYRSSVRRVASYNVRSAPFANLTARQDAERRAARELADDIRTLLALHFQQRTEQA